MMPNDRDLRLQHELDLISAGCLNRLWWSLKERWLHGNRYEADRHFLMAIYRLTDTGPYTPDGQYDKSHRGWRYSEVDHRQVAWHQATMPRSTRISAAQAAGIADAVTDP